MHKRDRPLPMPESESPNPNPSPLSDQPDPSTQSATDWEPDTELIESSESEPETDSMSLSDSETHSLTADSSNNPPSSPSLSQSSHRPPNSTLVTVRSRSVNRWRLSPSLILLVAIAITLAGIFLDLPWLGLAATTVVMVIAVGIIVPQLTYLFLRVFSEWQRSLTLAVIGILVGLSALFRFTTLDERLRLWSQWVNWEAVGALGDAFGALGQILIAILAVYVAWRQYVIEKDLTTQQNLITQQQTIDTYFQGISDLVLDEEGLLEDWPQERAIAEGRTAAILSSADAEGKAKVIRFLSRSKLLTPLRRDSRLGRAILDGTGGYQEDRNFGVRVIDLGVMLANANLSKTDLRWTDLSDANLIRANLSQADLVKANLSRTILYNANLQESDLMGVRLFYGPLITATPRTRTNIPDYMSGQFTGAVVENADFTNVKRMSEGQRQYCCAWGGAKTRATIPGGCDDVPDLLAQHQDNNAQ